MGISFRDAKAIINQVRNVKFEGMHGEQRGMNGPWFDILLREDTISAEVPTGYSCRVTRPKQVVVHATASDKDGAGLICCWSQGAAGKRDVKDKTMTVEDFEEAADQFGGKFCENCEPLMRASLRLQARQLWAD